MADENKTPTDLIVSAAPQRRPAVLPELDQALAASSVTEAQLAADLIAAANKDNRPKRATELEMDVRRRHAFNLRLRGLGLAEIAEQLSTSVGTVKRDLDEVSKELKEHVKNFDKDEAISQSLSVYEDVIQSAWREYDKAADGSEVRLKAMNLVRAAENDKIRIMQEVGIIQREAQKTHHTIDVNVISGWSKELQKLAASQLLETMMTDKLLPPIPDPDIQDAVILQEAPLDPLSTEDEPDDTTGSNEDV